MRSSKNWISFWFCSCSSYWLLVGAAILIAFADDDGSAPESPSATSQRFRRLLVPSPALLSAGAAAPSDAGAADAEPEPDAEPDADAEAGAMTSAGRLGAPTPLGDGAARAAVDDPLVPPVFFDGMRSTTPALLASTDFMAASTADGFGAGAGFAAAAGATPAADDGGPVGAAAAIAATAMGS